MAAKTPPPPPEAFFFLVVLPYDDLALGLIMAEDEVTQALLLPVLSLIDCLFQPYTKII